MTRLGIASIFIGFNVVAIAAAPTFNKEVLPILQANCQGCHRPGEVAPMSLIHYSDARPWAKAIKNAVASRRMPPWFAEEGSVHIANDRRLSQKDIETIIAWVDGGAAEGDAKDKPAPLAFNNGWNIKPDMVIEMPEPYQLPAKGTVDYQYILVKGNIQQELWVKSAEMRPGNSRVLHHGKVFVRPTGSKFMANAIPGVAYARTTAGENEMSDGNDIIGKFNPGLGAQTFEIDGSAKLIPKGSDFVFELHYTTMGQETSDRSKVGLVLAKGQPEKRYFLSPGTPAAFNLTIPAGDSHAEVVSEVTINEPATLVYVQPHMHVRGKDYEMRLIYPTGESETILKAKWDFEWQLGYNLAKPIDMPKGTRMLVTTHYDNSANNKFNPDPTATVNWGDQSWEEMQGTFVGMVIPAKGHPDKVFVPSGVSLLKKGDKGPTMAQVELPKK